MFSAETIGLDWPLNFFFFCAFTFLDNITVATDAFFFFDNECGYSTMCLSGLSFFILP